MLPSSFVFCVWFNECFCIRASSPATGLPAPASPPLLHAAPFAGQVLSSEPVSAAYADNFLSEKKVIPLFISQRIDVILKGTDHSGDDATERADKV